MMKKILSILLLFVLASSISWAVNDSKVVARDGVAKRTRALMGSGASSGTTVVVSSAVISVTHGWTIIDTEGDAATDTLSTINATDDDDKYDSFQDGDILILSSELASQDVTIDETGNVDNQGVAVVLNDTGTRAAYQYIESSTSWILVFYNDSLTGQTFTDLTVTTIDCNGGAIDGTVIGGSTPAAGTFTTLTMTTMNATILGGKLTGGTQEIEGNNFDINGGTVDGVIIGSAAPPTVPTGSATSAGVNTANATWEISDGTTTYYIPLYTSQ